MRGDAVQQPQLWEAVVERVRSAILTGELPAGTKLVESDLADRFGTSRGPVREAIRELAREGLVLELPRRGTVVATLSARDLAEVYAVREALELGATRVVVAGASDEQLRRLERHIDAITVAADYLEAAEHDLAFHRELVALSENARLASIYEQMLTQTALLLRTAAAANPTLRGGMRRSAHQDMLDALLARDEGAVRAAIDAHYRYAEERLFSAFGDEEPR